MQKAWIVAGLEGAFSSAIRTWTTPTKTLPLRA